MLASACKLASSLLLRHPVRQQAADLSIRTVRPSLLDTRFSGDPWIVDRGNGPFAICLGNYPLAWIDGLAMDLPSLNRLFQTIRHRRPRLARTVQMRKPRPKQAVAAG